MRLRLAGVGSSAKQVWQVRESTGSSVPVPAAVFPVIANGHQLIDLGDDALLFGDGRARDGSSTTLLVDSSTRLVVPVTIEVS